ncbi:hypothetical protein PG990_011017 [Apiospora arundinis]
MGDEPLDSTNSASNPSVSSSNPRNEIGDLRNGSLDAEIERGDSQPGPQSNSQDHSQHGFDPGYGGSELHKSIKNHDVQTLTQLINGSTNLEVEDEYGERPLYLAARLGLLEAVQVLLEKGADVESQNTRSLDFPNALYQAVSRNSVQIAEVLLQHGADINAWTWNGTTPLAIAVGGRAVEIVDLLLQYGADKEAKDNNGITIRALAAESPQILTLLQAPLLLQGPSTSNPQATKPSKRRTQRDMSAPVNDRDKMVSLHHFTAVMIDFFLIEGSERRMMQSLSVFDLLYGDEALREPPQHGVLLGREPDFRWYHLPENNMDWVRHVALESPEFTVLSDDFKYDAGLKGSRDKHHTKKPISFMRPKWPDGEVSDNENIVAFMPYLHHESQPRHKAFSEDLKKLIGRKSKAEEVPDMNPPAPGLAEYPGNWPLKGQEGLYKHLVKGYLDTGPNDEELHLQLRRTLDQYFFPDTDTTGRDQDQVVYRYSKEHYPEPRLFMVDQLWLWVINGDTLITCASNGLGPLANANESRPATAPGPPQAPVLYLNQLFPFRQQQQQRHKSKKRVRQWAANLDQGWYSMDQFETNITTDWHKYNVPTLEEQAMNIHGKIIKHLNLPSRAPIKSAYELAILTANYCAAVFDPNQTPEQFQFFDFFERTITRAVRGEASEMREQLRDAGGQTGDAEAYSKLHTRREFDLLTETDDIQEELGILRRVLADERKVKSRLDAICAKLGHNTHQFVHDGGIMFKEHDEVEGHIDRIDAMEQRARRTNETVRTPLCLTPDYPIAALYNLPSCQMTFPMNANNGYSLQLSYLLDQKQKRANYEGALASVSYAKQRAEIAAESARQGRTLTLFTVVTIVFLPLSFMSAFFAINIDVFPVNADGKLELGYVLKYMRPDRGLGRAHGPPENQRLLSISGGAGVHHDHPGAYLDRIAAGRGESRGDGPHGALGAVRGPGDRGQPFHALCESNCHGYVRLGGN